MLVDILARSQTCLMPDSLPYMEMFPHRCTIFVRLSESDCAQLRPLGPNVNGSEGTHDAQHFFVVSGKNWFPSIDLNFALHVKPVLK